MYKILITCYLLFTLPFCLCAQEVWSGLKEPQTVLPKGNAPSQVAVQIPFREPHAKLEEVSSNQWIISDGWTLSAGGCVSGERSSDERVKIKPENFWSNQKFNATVPGTVLTTLINQGVYPDPYYGLNNMSIPDSLSKMDWWYDISFPLPNDYQKGKKLFLLFNGINYRSEIILNDTKIGETKGAFERCFLDITEIAKDAAADIAADAVADGISATADKENCLHLQVHIFPLDHPGIPHEQSMSEGQGLNGGETSYDGPTFIASVGWDWMPAIRDRNIGLWQDVRLISTGAVRIEDPLIMTDLPLPDTTSADIRIEIMLRNCTDAPSYGKLLAKIKPYGKPSARPIEVSVPYYIEPSSAKKIILSPKANPKLRIKNPELWWPNGYGDASLYELELSAMSDDTSGTLSDIKSVRFGIRELSYELMAYDRKKGNIRVEYNPNQRFASKAARAKNLKFEPVFDNEARVLVSAKKNLFIPAFASKDRAGISVLDSNDPVGPNLVIKVNGVRIFCRGGDWGMDDALKRTSREKLEPYFVLHKDLNFNIIRNWTGETTQESFYTLCDEYGMLVWNDFWMTGEDTVGPLDFELFLSNATDVVRRFRHHPSIAIWGPRNEGFAPKGLEEMLSRMVAREDPTRHYHGQSRFLNMGTSGPWSYFEDRAYYFRERADGFNTEMGSFSIPVASTIRKFIAPEDRWPINDVWAYHDLHHTSQNFEGFMGAVEKAGGMPEGLEAVESLEKADSLMEIFADAAQSVCYDAWRAMLESWNSRMWNNTTGLILWMSHPAWPSFIWQTYSYDYEKNGAYEGAKKACEPIHIQMNPGLDDSSPSTVSIINVTRKNLTGLKAVARIYDANGALIKEISYGDTVSAGCSTSVSNSTYGVTHLTALANSQTICFQLPSPAKLPKAYTVHLTLYGSNGDVVSENRY